MSADHLTACARRLAEVLQGVLGACDCYLHCPSGRSEQERGREGRRRTLREWRREGSRTRRERAKSLSSGRS
eukprot:6184313-Pleurochrysis_carterae.AAC.2